MAAVSGPSPWSDDYEGFRRLSKAKLKKGGYEHIPGRGYVKGRELPHKKKVTLSDGSTVEVYESNLGIPIGYHGPAPDTDLDKYLDKHGQLHEEDVGLFISKVFDGKHKVYKVTMEESSHIRVLEYSAYYQLLKVTFWNGSTVVYFRVPSTVSGELYHLGQSNAMSNNSFDGSRRHVIGIRFWDLVRIRGTLTGSRYKFKYVAGGDRSLSGVDAVLRRRKSGRRYDTDSKYVKVDVERAKDEHTGIFRKRPGEAANDNIVVKLELLAKNATDPKLKEAYEKRAAEMRKRYPDTPLRSAYLKREDVGERTMDVDSLEEWLDGKYDQHTIDNLWTAYEEPKELFRAMQKSGRIPADIVWEDL